MGVTLNPAGDGVTALARGLALLRAFRPGERSLAHQDLVRRTGLPKATVSRLAATLIQLGYLDQSPSSGRYSLGTGVLALANAYLAGQPLRATARGPMQALADALKSTVMLGAREGNAMILLEICHGHPSYRLRLDVGSRVPHNTTALGRAYLAALPEAARQHFVAAGEASGDPEWPAVAAGIQQAAADFAQYGFCLSLGDWNPDLYAAGVPLVSADGGRVMALGVSGPVFDMTRARLIGEVGPRLVALRDELLTLTGGDF